EGGAGLEVLADEPHPVVGGQRLGPYRVLHADLGEDDEVACELVHIPGLLVVGKVDGPVRDLDVAAALRQAEGPEVVEGVAGEVFLEQRAAEEEGDLQLKIGRASCRER